MKTIQRVLAHTRRAGRPRSQKLTLTTDDCVTPRGGFFTRDGRWAVENEGVGPDIEVENWPKDVIAGRDPQLERVVEEAMRLLKERPVDRMTKEPLPPTWGRRP